MQQCGDKRVTDTLRGRRLRGNESVGSGDGLRRFVGKEMRRIKNDE